MHLHRWMTITCAVVGAWTINLTTPVGAAADVEPGETITKDK
jgi:hypothetical protein